MKAAWPPGATDEECSLRLFKDALMKRSMAGFGALRSPEGEEEEDAYAG